MATYRGAPSATDLQTILDKLGSLVKNQWSNIGLAAPGETSTTLAMKAATAVTGILGDGSSAYGIGNTELQRRISQSLTAMADRAKGPFLFSFLTADILRQIDNWILETLPSRSSTDGWKFTNSQNLRPLDLHLTRLNANNSNTPATPSYTITLTATTGGSIVAPTGGRVKVTMVGSQDYYESQPTAAAGPTALTGKNNAYTLGGLTGNVPTGVTKLRVYRQIDGAAGGDPYFWDQDVAVTAGQTWASQPTVTLKNRDQDLRQDWNPPAWNTFYVMQESAILYMLALAAARSGGAVDLLPSFSTPALLSFGNVCLNPASGFQGFNPATAAEFGRASVTTYTEGQIQSSNDASQGLQGVVGAINGVQARTLTTLNSAATLSSISYRYYDSSNPTTIQTGSISPAGTLGTVVGNTLDFTIPAGRVVTRIVSMTITGPSSGTFLVEAITPRSI